ncbi:hypothetical protein NUACC21_73390 [Scytonema sp. NUACC21]
MAITINPVSENFVLSAEQIVERIVTVYVPRSAPIPKIDVYFLADTTGSMKPIIDAVRAGADTILNSLTTFASDLDICFGVGNYRDFSTPKGNEKYFYTFEHQLSLTADKSQVSAAINTWTVESGTDYSEGQLFALDQLAQAPGGSIGWRNNSKRIIVWFGDAPGHDPICPALSHLVTAEITEDSVTKKLASEKILVIAISSETHIAGGLDGDPRASAAAFVGICPIGGNPGQAQRIVQNTGGKHYTKIEPNKVVETIIQSTQSVISVINNLSLVPTEEIAPFVTSITPVSGYGPLANDREHILTYSVRYAGVRSALVKKLVFNGKLNAVADGAVMASQDVTITKGKSTITIKADSAGAKSGNFAFISLNDSEIGFGNYTRGLNVAVFDETTGQLLTTTSFDTFIYSNAKSFAYFIESLPNGRIVAITVKDDATGCLFSDPEVIELVTKAFLSIGSIKFFDLKFQGSGALIGQKGASVGSATEEVSETAPVSVTRGFEILPVSDLRPLVTVTSVTPQHKGEVEITLNGTKVEIEGGYYKGLNVAVIDEVQGTLILGRAFNIFENPASIDAFVELINSLPSGRIVAIAMKQGSETVAPNTNPFPDSVKTACTKLGSLRVYYVWEKGIWAMVGAKGAAIGSARENLDNGSQYYLGYDFLIEAGVSIRSWGTPQ